MLLGGRKVLSIGFPSVAMTKMAETRRMFAYTHRLEKDLERVVECCYVCCLNSDQEGEVEGRAAVEAVLHCSTAFARLSYVLVTSSASGETCERKPRSSI